MAKNIVIILGHPDPDPSRYCRAIADAYERGAAQAGHRVTTINVGELKFPLLSTAQDFENGSIPEALAIAQSTLKHADKYVIIYPLWHGMLPAKLKAFFEQIFRPGFGVDVGDGTKMPKKLLKGKTARIIVTMGMPGAMYRWFYAAHSLKALKRNVLQFSGISPVRTNVLGMVEAVKNGKRQAWLKKVEKLGQKAR